MRIEKVEVIEMAISYIENTKKEGIGNRNENVLEINEAIRDNCINEAYSKGLKDGMNSILKFLQLLNQLENKINEQAFELAQKFKNDVIKKAGKY
jgi:hypothetical protein